MIKLATWFLGLSYAIAAPTCTVLEYRGQLFSERFDYPPSFLYLVFAVQFVAALGLFRASLRPWAALVLTATTIGAIISHIRIGSPQTAAAAIGYTFLQVWLAVQHIRDQPARPS